MNHKTSPALRAAVIALGIACVAPAMAQTTTVPSTGTSSPAGRDAQGHAADSTTPMAHPKGHGAMSASGTATGTGHTVKSAAPRTSTTPTNTTPGAGLRNSGDAVPPTSGAAGR